MAVCCLSILRQLDKIDLEKAIQFVASCKNFDGGFGCTPGAESHTGQSIFVFLHMEWFERFSFCIPLFGQ